MRRELRFKTLDDARAELARLEKGPVETFGSWSYFQILTHCAKALDGSAKGIKRDIPFFKRHILGPISYWDIKLRGFIPAGIQGPKTERIEGDEKAALEQLRKALDDFEKSVGPCEQFFSQNFASQVRCPAIHGQFPLVRHGTNRARCNVHAFDARANRRVQIVRQLIQIQHARFASSSSRSTSEAAAAPDWGSENLFENRDRFNPRIDARRKPAQQDWLVLTRGITSRPRLKYGMKFEKKRP